MDHVPISQHSTQDLYLLQVSLTPGILVGPIASRDSIGDAVSPTSQIPLGCGAPEKMGTILCSPVKLKNKLLKKQIVTDRLSF